MNSWTDIRRQLAGNCFRIIVVSTAAQRVSAQSTQPIDLGTPKQTIATLFAAVNDADASTIKRTFLAETPQTQELSTAYADLVVAGHRLREAAKAKFAADNANAAPVRDGTTPGQPPPEQAAQLAAATVHIDGDAATVSIPDRPAPIKLRQLNGEWLIDLADFAATTPSQISEQADVDHNLAAAIKEAADEITAGRYASAQEAESAVQQKIHAVISPAIKSIPATIPTTAPTPAPTPAPTTAQTPGPAAR